MVCFKVLQIDGFESKNIHFKRRLFKTMICNGRSRITAGRFDLLNVNGITSTLIFDGVSFISSMDSEKHQAHIAQFDWTKSSNCYVLMLKAIRFLNEPKTLELNMLSQKLLCRSGNDSSKHILSMPSKFHYGFYSVQTESTIIFHFRFN